MQIFKVVFLFSVLSSAFASCLPQMISFNDCINGDLDKVSVSGDLSIDECIIGRQKTTSASLKYLEE